MRFTLLLTSNKYFFLRSPPEMFGTKSLCRCLSQDLLQHGVRGEVAVILSVFAKYDVQTGRGERGGGRRGGDAAAATYTKILARSEKPHCASPAEVHANRNCCYQTTSRDMHT